jgi:hypothetical protein
MKQHIVVVVEYLVKEMLVVAQNLAMALAMALVVEAVLALEV